MDARNSHSGGSQSGDSIEWPSGKHSGHRSPYDDNVSPRTQSPSNQPQRRHLLSVSKNLTRSTLLGGHASIHREDDRFSNELKNDDNDEDDDFEDTAGFLPIMGSNSGVAKKELSLSELSGKYKFVNSKRLGLIGDHDH